MRRAVIASAAAFIAVVGAVAPADARQTVSTTPKASVYQFEEIPAGSDGKVHDIEKSTDGAWVGGENIGGVYWVSTSSGVTYQYDPGVPVYGILNVNAAIFIVAGTKVMRLDPPSTTPTWSLDLGAKLTDIEKTPDSKLLVAGDIPGGLAVINYGGVNQHAVVPSLTGRTNETLSGPTGIYRIAMQPGGTRISAIGEFTHVGGVEREQHVMYNYNSSSQIVKLNWDAPEFHNNCANKSPAFLRDTQWGPGGNIVYMAGKGGSAGPGQICDSIIKMNGTLTNNADVPIEAQVRTCADSIYSIGVSPDGESLLIGGHFKCIEATPMGSRDMQPRYGLAQLRTSDMTLRSWKSDKCRAEGARAITWDSEGAWVGYDCEFWGNSEADDPAPSSQFARKRLAFLPYAGEL